MYKLFLTLRYLRKRRIAYFAIAAVMLCTAMVLIVMSVMGGFLDQLKIKARGLLGDLVIDNRVSAGFPLYQEFIDEISAWPEIEQATPLIYAYGIIRFGDSNRTNTVRVVGMRYDEVIKVNAFEPGLYYEKFYPGTTHLGLQRQPMLGYDEQLSPRSRLNPDYLLPILPQPYRDALARSRAAGVVDDETAETSLAEALRAEGGEPIPGVYEINPQDEQEPTLAGDPFPGLIVGRDLIAERLPDGRYERFAGSPRGSKLTLTLVPISMAGTVDTPIKQAFRYADDSRTGIYEIDSRHVYCDFELLQQLLMMNAAPRVNPTTGETLGSFPARCSQIQIKMRPVVDGRRVDPNELAQRLEAKYRSYIDDPRFLLDFEDGRLISWIDAKTWEQSQEHIIAPVEKERILVSILFSIISLVAAVLVLCILYMIVLQKTRDIGIIKAIGGSSAGAAGIFLFYGAAVGVVGAVIGSVLGVAFVVNINRIQSFLTSLNPAWQVWDRSVYSFDEIPNTVRIDDVVTVFIAAILASTLGSVMAAWRAGAMQPVEALRHE